MMTNDFFHSRSGLPLLPLLAACVAGAACICMLLMKAGATPNAVSTPTTLAGKSATVAGEILDSWDESGGTQGAGETDSQFTGHAATAGDYASGSEGTVGEHVSGPDSTACLRPSASDLVPRARFRREVRLRSDADIETWAYILVEIPQVRAALEGEEPHMQDALMPSFDHADFELVGESTLIGGSIFQMPAGGMDRSAGAESFEAPGSVISRLVTGIVGDAHTQTRHLFLYRCRRQLRPGETTPPLFSEVAVPDFSEAEALTGELSAVGWLIQAAHLDAEEADALARKWAGVRPL